mmetsp:Transcript_5843/g.19883  ORF Transcript_5843/g.19883 Transcript_5843/m.19883 type:complete len:465 (+) Transcript_5843:133-1527(+)
MRRCSNGSAPIQTKGWGLCWLELPPSCQRRKLRRLRRISRLATRTARTSQWWTLTKVSPTSTSRATSLWTPRCPTSFATREACGAQMASFTRPRRSFPTGATPASTRRWRSFIAFTGHSTRQRWGALPTSGSWPKKAQEYGSHDKTFEIQAAGLVRVVDEQSGKVLTAHHVEKGDIFRGCQTKAAPVEDWINLAVKRASASGSPVVFWLDPERSHDTILIRRVNEQLAALQNTKSLDIRILDPVKAVRFTMEQIKDGKDVISATGNVLRDYLTDLFPILELGTSAKMLSIVPLLAGGGLYETGAGGSAPKHVQQLVAENHLRWDSLGEFLALAVSLEELGRKLSAPTITTLAASLNDATARLLDEGKSPQRKVHELDNRHSHYYIAKFWTEALARQSTSPQLRSEVAPMAEALADKEDIIVKELLDCQGEPQNLGGYYRLDDNLVQSVMRPSPTLNAIIDASSS